MRTYKFLLVALLSLVVTAKAVEFGDPANDGGGGINLVSIDDGDPGDGGDQHDISFTLLWPSGTSRPVVTVAGAVVSRGLGYYNQGSTQGYSSCLCTFAVEGPAAATATVSYAGTQVFHVSGTGTITVDVARFIAPTAPTIVTQPQSVSVNVGQAVSFSVQVKGTRPITSKRYDFGTGGSGSGTVLETHSITTGNATDTATDTFQYTTSAIAASNGHQIGVQVINDGGQQASSLVLVSVGNPSPTITAQPQNKSLTSGDTLTLTVAASQLSGQSPALAYQWQKDGTSISGATAATYTKTNVSTSDAGTYTCAVTGGGGTTISQGAAVTVAQAKGSFTSQPQGGSVQDGQSKTLSVSVQAPAGYTGGAATYQWYKDGQIIAGANGSSYTISGMTAADAGSYVCVATWGDFDSETSAAAGITYQSTGTGGGDSGGQSQVIGEGMHTVTYELVNIACPYQIYLDVRHAAYNYVDFESSSFYTIAISAYAQGGGRTEGTVTNQHYGETFPTGLDNGAINGWINRITYQSQVSPGGPKGQYAWLHADPAYPLISYITYWDQATNQFQWFTNGVIVALRKNTGTLITDSDGVAWTITSDGQGNWHVKCEVNMGGGGATQSGSNTDPSGDQAYQDYKKALDDAGAEQSGVTAPASTDAAADYTGTFDDRGKLDDIHGQLATARQSMDGTITGIQTKFAQATDTSWIPTQWGTQTTWGLGTVNMGGRQFNLGFDVGPFGQTLTAVRAMLLFAESVVFTILIVVTVRAYL